MVLVGETVREENIKMRWRKKKVKGDREREREGDNKKNIFRVIN